MRNRDPRFFWNDSPRTARRLPRRLRTRSAARRRRAQRNVRNFWVELDVDGRSRVATGPARKDGGFDMIIKMRDDGGIAEVAEILGRANGDDLTLRVNVDGKESVVNTKR